MSDLNVFDEHVSTSSIILSPAASYELYFNLHLWCKKSYTSICHSNITISSV